MTFRMAALLVALQFSFTPTSMAQSKAGGGCPMMAAHQKGVNERGDKVMGFSHERTTHHFHLYADGGAIEVQADDPQDADSREQIRTHLAHIARIFAAGDFEAPMLIHSRVLPGVPTMKRLKNEITYQYLETERGGMVRITTRSSKAVKAIHQFLRFQISDHQTGNSGKVEAGKV